MPEKTDKDKKDKKDKKRCCVCRKKQLTNIICKCGKIVCISHRYATSHSCTFDWKQKDLNNLGKQLEFKPANKIEVV